MRRAIALATATAARNLYRESGPTRLISSSAAYSPVGGRSMTFAPTRITLSAPSTAELRSLTATAQAQPTWPRAGCTIRGSSSAGNGTSCYNDFDLSNRRVADARRIARTSWRNTWPPGAASACNGNNNTTWASADRAVSRSTSSKRARRPTVTRTTIRPAPSNAGPISRSIGWATRSFSVTS